MEKLTHIYIKEVVRLHGVLISIISDNCGPLTHIYLSVLAVASEVTGDPARSPTIPKQMVRVRGPSKPWRIC